MGDLKSYVAGGEQRQVAEGTVLLDLTHNYLKNQYVEIPFDTHWTIRRCKDKLYTTFGTSPEHMTLSLNGVPLTDDSATLAMYGAKNRMVLHCTDTDPFSAAKGGALEDTSLVKKYEMSDEAYDKRENTYRAYKKKMLAEDPNWVPQHVAEARAKKAEARAAKGAPEEAETLESVQARMKIGDRFEALGGRRGVIKYVGFVDEIKSEQKYVWVGVEFDEMEGKHDGTIQGKRYFEAVQGKGSFLQSHLVKAGEYPEEDPFASSGSEDEMEEL